MPQSVAEAYLLILRSSMVPILGEATAFPFTGQIDVSKWHWDLKYDEKGNDGKGATTSSDPSEKGAKSAFNGVELIKAVQKMQTSAQFKQEDRDKKVRELIKKATDAQADADKQAGNEDSESGTEAAAGTQDSKDNGLKFSFDKNVDLASTQLLNSMKAGERLRAVLTLHHRSTNAPVSLVITFGNVLLTNYSLAITPEDTMSELTESWTAEYETVDYVYKNRPAAAGPNFVTQGTARVFKMKLKSLF